MATDQPPGAERVVIGNKIIFANRLTVEGSLNLGNGEPAVDKVELLLCACDGGVVDVVFRNRGDASAYISGAELVVEEMELVPQSASFLLRPVTWQYNVLLPLDRSRYPIALSQEGPSTRT